MQTVMRRFASLYDAIDRTTSTNGKVAAMVAYFKAAPPADASWAVFFLTGRRLKRLISYPAIHQWTLMATGLDTWLLEECYSVVGDGAETVALVLDQVAVETTEDVALAEWVEGRILPLRGLDPETQQRRVSGWWSALDRLQRFSRGILERAGFIKKIGAHNLFNGREEALRALMGNVAGNAR